MRRRPAQLLLATVLCAGLMASTAAAAGGPVALGGASALKSAKARQATLRSGCPAVALNAPALAQEGAMLCLIGEARARNGLSPLTPSSTLKGSAAEKGADLLRCDEFSHTACGREFSFWIQGSGYMDADCWRVGENLAWGVEGQGTVGSIFRAWMRSPTHRANILGDFEETGIDLRLGQLGGLTDVHLWTQHFGSHCGS